MGMIDRYRKKGGFVQLLNLIETTGKEKQEKFLSMIKEESPAWEAEIRNKMLTLDKVLSWNSTYLAEIFPHVPAIQLAMIIGGLPAEKSQIFLNVLNYKEKKQVQDQLEAKKPTTADAASGVVRLFAEIRKLAQDGTLKFEKFASDMVIPEDIEEKLGNNIHSLSHIVKQVEVNSEVHQGLPSQVTEELNQLRRKLVHLTQENQRLNQENTTMKDKLEQIKKIA